MPKRKRNYRYKPRKRRRRYRRRLQRVYRNPVLGRSKLVHHRYYGERTIDPGVAGLLSGHVFKANGMWDPDVTGAGHQPLGFDEMATIFNHFCVIKSKINVTASFQSVTDSTHAIIGVTLTNTSTAVVTAQNAVENGYTNYKVIHTSEAGPVKLRKSFTNRFLGYKHPMSERDLKGQVSNDPSEEAFYQVWIEGLNSTNTSGASIVVVIDYWAVWTEPIILASS